MTIILQQKRAYKPLQEYTLFEKLFASVLYRVTKKKYRKRI